MCEGLSFLARRVGVKRYMNKREREREREREIEREEDRERSSDKQTDMINILSHLCH